MKILVSGSSGFIGSHLIDALINFGHDVTGIDMKEPLLPDHKKIWTKLSINNPNLWDYLDEYDVIFHLAATPRVQYSVEHPLETNQNNIEGTLKMLEFARKKANRFIFASSSSIYGGKTCELMEGLCPHPKSPYALQKLVGEEYCRLYNEIYGLDTISLRFFNVYGRRMNPKGDYACLIPRHIALAKKNCNLPVYGLGAQKRSFTYVEDVVQALIAAGESKKRFFGEIINIAYPECWSVNEVDKIIIAATKSKSKIKYLPARKGDPAMSLANTEKAERILNWKAKISLPDGIEKIKEIY